ncbi:Uma2 family endonuclease [Caldilinea sp.]|jgi:hypothetical protein|uniref:Uma2 family endonuclease n=1 Tax=Caldilinea sp. TaxID=2293560 RepID=UPI002636787C|nr:Uma2 family endonuclease [Caldilinea sp.]
MKKRRPEEKGGERTHGFSTGSATGRTTAEIFIEAIDCGVKFEDYATHGVREDWIIDPDAERLMQPRCAGCCKRPTQRPYHQANPKSAKD